MITADFDRLPLHPGDRVLDIGCGTGRHINAVYQRADVHVIGIDLNLGEVREAKNRLALNDRLGLHGKGQWSLCIADTLRLPFADASFDLLVCSEVLEHICDHRSAVAEVTRVLRPGCQLVVSVPRYWPEKICWSLSKAYRCEKGGHVRIYRKARLIEFIHGAGFELRSAHYAHGLHTPYWWLKCLVGLHRSDHLFVRLYHRILVWDMFQQPPLTRLIERLLNPVFGKSVVLYFIKRAESTGS